MAASAAWVSEPDGLTPSPGGLEFARVIGWAVACAVWVVLVERQWQARIGPFLRFFAQLVLWVGAALLAIWISEQFRLRLTLMPPGAG